ncbi:hypothetical protein AGDE_12024 [Angomonas deanei]|nr:hypothetical protein AGDE_12024 [Angomonas deanei]|eukprot:EPY25092.1 hypothetical protein AGDE_12024 [Angomonas deanei]
MTEKAERIKSTSVHAGESLLESRKVVDSGEYYFHDNTTTSLPEGEAELERENFSRLKQLKESRPRADRKAAADGTAEGEDLGRSGPSVFDESVKADENPAQPWEKPQLSPSQQMSLELKKLEYYEGSPKYPEMLREFLEKYGGDSPEQEVDEAKAYSKEEVEMGLEAQPLDYLRGSSKLQAHLLSGARQYDPITVMQQQGVMRFQGYAFPPSTELGKLKNIEDVKSVVDSHKDKSFLSSVRRSFNALTGKQSDKDDYVATGDKPVEDTHLLYRTLGLDAVQRRQMRFMLTDFDYADRQTAFHVMMTYPYTDWIHVIYMVLVGVALYELQVRYEAYEFYDEYMGLDLRQVPGMKKPLLAAITIGVMAFSFPAFTGR